MTTPLGPRPRTLRLSSAAALLIALIGAGCASTPPTNYYTLGSSGREESAAAAVHEKTTPIIVAVGPVNLPDYLDRPQFVTRESTYTLKLAGNDRWAGPLSDMVPQVLREDLALRLPGDRVLGFPTPDDSPFDYRVVAEVTRFDVDGDGTATLVARWRIYKAKGGPAALTGEDFQQQQATGRSYEAYAAALSGTLAALSDSIATGFAQVRREAK